MIRCKGVTKTKTLIVAAIRVFFFLFRFRRSKSGVSCHRSFCLTIYGYNGKQYPQKRKLKMIRCIPSAFASPLLSEWFGDNTYIIP